MAKSRPDRPVLHRVFLLEKQEERKGDPDPDDYGDDDGNGDPGDRGEDGDSDAQMVTLCDERQKSPIEEKKRNLKTISPILRGEREI